jgi:hypothetical protein
LGVKNWFTGGITPLWVVGNGTTCCENTGKILVLEKKNLPHGASTKNAGFACFGSISEIIDDLNHIQEEVYQLVTKRLEGRLLRRGDEAIDFKLMEV